MNVESSLPCSARVLFLLLVCSRAREPCKSEVCLADSPSAQRGLSMIQVGRITSPTAKVPHTRKSAVEGARALAVPQSLVDGGDATLDVMKYWTVGEEPLPATDKYVLFTPDVGGPNNIRIGWEMVGVVAQYTNRTLVLPKATSMYLLDFGPMSAKYHPKGLTGGQTKVEDLINLKQLKANLPTLTAEEFEAKENVRLENVQAVAQQPQKATQCDLPAYGQMTDKYVFMDGAGQNRDGFACGEWWELGAPKEEMKRDMRDKDWALLRHGFVWHDDAFKIASQAVNFLSTFNYVAVHARYGDFQFHDVQKSPSEIFEPWKQWLTKGTTLYLASDQPEKFRNMDLPGVRVVMWEDFFRDSTNNLLAETKSKYTPERWFKMFGPVEELICTYAKLFVGTDKSSFSGHIERMRLHAGAPVALKLTHTSGVPADKVNQLIQDWDAHKNGKATTNPSAMPVDKFL